MTGIYKQSFPRTSKQVIQNHTNLLFVMENSSNSTFNLKWNLLRYCWKSSKLYESFFLLLQKEAISSRNLALNFSSLKLRHNNTPVFQDERAISKKQPSASFILNLPLTILGFCYCKGFVVVKFIAACDFQSKL